MYVCVGLGVLTKGPVAAVLPALVFLTYLAAHRELPRVREMMIPAGTLVALLIAAPWYVALYAQHGWTYITEFFIGENLGRYTDTVGTQVRGPLFYIPVVFTDSLPWSLFLPAAVAAWLRERNAPDGRIRTILILWIGITVLFFSFSQTKQDLYIFPIVAAIAALGADWIARALDDRTSAASRWFTGTMVTVGTVVAAAGAFVLYVFVSRSVYQLDGAQMAGAVALAGGAAAAVTALARHRVAAVLVALTALVAFNWVLLLRVLPSFEAYKPSVPLSDVIRRAAAPGDVVMHFDVAMPSMVYYLQRHIDITFDSERLHRQIKSDRKVFAVLPAHRYPQLKIELGVPTCELARHPIGEVRLRDLLELEPLPEIVLITNRCPTGTPPAAVE
jgi:4-amino-4-deoxy-L-arabinose transferase-like glycosyltransferase